MKTIESIPSVLTRSQFKEYGPRTINFKGQRLVIRATARYDDKCKNGHNTFSICGEYHEAGRSRDSGGGGQCIEEISAAFPELIPFLKWHLCSSDEPMYYIANTVYHAGNRDCHGLLKGEFRQHLSCGKYQADGIEGVPNWELEAPDCRDVYATEKPADVVLKWLPSGRTGEGKERDFDAARQTAIWPEATDEQLSLPASELTALLNERHPALMAEFRAAIQTLGFIY